MNESRESYSQRPDAALGLIRSQLAGPLQMRGRTTMETWLITDFCDACSVTWLQQQKPFRARESQASEGWSNGRGLACRCMEEKKTIESPQPWNP
jgi:hypothetical protein